MFLSKLLRFVLVVVLLIAALVTGGFFWWKSRGLPQREGGAALAGLQAPVAVRWDRWAVPYVQAESAADATAALSSHRSAHDNARSDAITAGAEERARTGPSRLTARRAPGTGGRSRVR